MIYEQAETLLNEILAPLTADEFFDVVGRNWREVKGDAEHPRRHLLGDDPKRAILDAYRTHADQLDCHSLSATQPPPSARAVSSADEFSELIKSFHERDYTVRIPEVIALSPNLQRFARALEYMLHQPVASSAFWSKAGAQAIIHYDNRDNIIVQLEGRKRWFISTEPPGLQNNWKQVGEALPHLRQHRAVDVEPGDLIYIPRGTPHTVESNTESLHLSILFVPVTLRDAIIAALDHLSDFERPFRETAIARPAADNLDGLPATLRTGVSRLLALCESDTFLKSAMDHRSSRVIGDLPALPKSAPPEGTTGDTRVRHSPLAICQLRATAEVLDFSLPGGHIAIHKGVERELRFIATTSEFRVKDIPGSASEDVRIALVNRLIASGFLEAAS
jgi:hypothetical protein